ncbi:MAG: hypothetical protein H6594_07215 [Flavobacteriales bacterium]|nr:hypothetical protein [Flavobacteriales bacterium]
MKDRKTIGTRFATLACTASLLLIACGGNDADDAHRMNGDGHMQHMENNHQDMDHRDNGAGTMPMDSADVDSMEVGAVMYRCPMRCEGDKTYPKAGKCPSCGMPMREVKS